MHVHLVCKKVSSVIARKKKAKYWPEVTEPYGKILVEHGHEVSPASFTPVASPEVCFQIACHGNRWHNTADLSGPDEEAAHVKQSIDRLQKASGLSDVPKGWFLGNASNAHKYIRARVHKEAGVPLLYCSDTYADDIPYWVPSPLTLDGEKDEGMLMIPYSLYAPFNQCSASNTDCPLLSSGQIMITGL